MGRHLELDDLTKFVMVSNPQISPGLDKIAFVVSKTDEKSDNYVTTIWVVNRADGEPVKFLSGDKDCNPVWSPDGRQILFLSRRGLKKEERGNTLWLSKIEEGEPRLVMKMEVGIEQPHWSSDGSKIFFVSSVGGAEEDMRVIDRIPIWFDAVGFTYNKRKHLHVVDVASGIVEVLTSGEKSVVYAISSNSGQKVAYAASANDLDPRLMDLLFYDLDSGEHIKLTSGFLIESLCWSPDDKHIAFIGSDLKRGSSAHMSVWVMPVNGGHPENLTENLDRTCVRRVYYDLRNSLVSIPGPIWDGSYIYFPVSDGGRFNLYRVNYDHRKIEHAIAGDFSLEEFSVRSGIIVYSRVTSKEPAEVYIWEGEKERKITKFNDWLLSRLDLATPQRIEFKASDGERVEGWILKPYGLKEGDKRPTILDIHGGPKSKYGHSFMFELQLYTAKGYAVIYCNPRGSDGYTEDFGDIRKIYGTRDYEDIMEFVDHASAEYSYIDPQKIGVTGLSYGGFMTNWIVGHTNRFKAAISQNSISNWSSFFGTTDIGFYFAPDQIGGDPWSKKEDYAEKSPFNYAPMVSTPIMFIHSFEDYRCWYDQSIMFYTALKYLGKETRLVLFMEGSHVFRSLAKPRIRKKRLEQMIKWFDTHLKE